MANKYYLKYKAILPNHSKKYYVKEKLNEIMIEHIKKMMPKEKIIQGNYIIKLND